MTSPADSGSALDRVRTASRPSDLRITDMRIAVVGHDEWTWPILKLYTNQDLVGIGEVRDHASARYALMLKSRLLGENPCDVDRLFRKIKQFGGHGRFAGGVCGVEMALVDLAGKAYGVPAYMLLGGKFRDRIRCYADTPTREDPTDMGEALKKRIEMGYTFLKMDVGIWIVRGLEDALSYPDGMLETAHVMHPFTGIQVTDWGVEGICEYVAQVREVAGYRVPLAADHFGHICVESCVKLAQALDEFSLAWYEDMIPWQLTDQWARLKNACATPVCTGEDIYLKEGFYDLFEAQAVSIIHPDLASAGGLLETKKIADLAQEHGIPVALHAAGSPVLALASAHCAAAVENFLALEMHSVDVPWWDDIVDDVAKPLVQNGYMPLPERPGLGIDLNEEAIREHLATPSRLAVYPPGVFEPTEEWNELDSHDRTWS